MKIIKSILAVIGGIFLLLILLVVILVIAKPYGIDIVKLAPAILNKNQASSYDHPYLTNQQELILESVGIDPKKIPTKITPELQQCAISIIGEARANELASGGTPTISEILKLKSCLK